MCWKQVWIYLLTLQHTFVEIKDLHKTLSKTNISHIWDDTFPNSEHPYPHNSREKEKNNNLKVKNLTPKTSEEELKSHTTTKQNNWINNKRNVSCYKLPPQQLRRRCVGGTHNRKTHKKQTKGKETECCGGEVQQQQQRQRGNTFIQQLSERGEQQSARPHCLPTQTSSTGVYACVWIFRVNHTLPRSRYLHQRLWRSHQPSQSTCSAPHTPTAGLDPCSVPATTPPSLWL